DGVEGVHRAFSVPGVVARATLTRREQAALGAGAEDGLVRRRKEDRARLRICCLVEVRLHALGTHLSVLRVVQVAEAADDQGGDPGDVRGVTRRSLEGAVDERRTVRLVE